MFLPAALRALLLLLLMLQRLAAVGAAHAARPLTTMCNGHCRASMETLSMGWEYNHSDQWPVGVSRHSTHARPRSARQLGFIRMSSSTWLRVYRVRRIW